MKTYKLYTFGCQMNYSDSERVESYLQALGFSPTEDGKNATLVLFNTCSIRQKAEDRVYGYLKELGREKQTKPELMIAVTGCMVRKTSSKYSMERDRLFNSMRDLDIALNIDEMPQLATLIREINPDLEIPEIAEESLEDYFKIQATHNSYESKAQAFVPISNGCDKFCTYCIVPYSRGREKSRTMQDIIDEVERLVDSGLKEVTLVGQTVNSYGLGKYDYEKGKFQHLIDENKEPFVYLLEQLDKFYDKGLRRVRFTSPHPKDMSDQLIEAMSKLRTQMPYLHLPVQAGDDNLLKRMNRTYQTGQYREIINKLREKIPDISISTDVIVGFCGETEEEYQNTYDFFREIGFEHAYLAQYSDRSGTTAHRFLKDDIPRDVKKERWHKLNELLKENSEKALNRFVDKTVNVLVESQNGENCFGRSEHFKTVQFKSGRKLVGEIVPVKVTEALEWLLKGELV